MILILEELILKEMILENLNTYILTRRTDNDAISSTAVSTLIRCSVYELHKLFIMMKYNRHKNRVYSNIFVRIRTCRVIQ
jgi:hypothetical protein